MTTDRDSRLIEALTGALDSKAAALDAATLSRLNQARHQAIATRHRDARDNRWFGLGAATAAVLAGVVAIGLLSPGDGPADGIEFSSIDLLTEDTELVEELDFFLWLDNAEPPADDA
jgi:hypothetical protein